MHPNMVLKMPKYLDSFSKDLLNLEAILNGTTPSDVLSLDKERLYCETYESALGEIKRIMNLPPGSKVTFDLETVKTNPFVATTPMSDKYNSLYEDGYIPRPKIVAIGLSDRSGYGCSIPLYHRQTPFTGNQLGTIIKFLRFLFEDTDLEFVAHNGKFDMKWLRNQLDILVENNFIYDTMLMHYLGVVEEKGTHGLKELAWQETDMGGYDDALDGVSPKGVDDKGNYDLIDWDILKVYLADDADCTYRLLDKYLPLIEENPENKWLWNNLVLPGSNTLLDIECNGVFVDQEWLKRLEENYPKEIKRIYKKLHEFPEVLSIEREWQGMWEERVAIGSIQKANRTEEQQDKFTKYKRFDPSKGQCEFNFGSTTQLKNLLFVQLGLKTTILTDKGEELKRIDPSKITWEHFSTNDDSLKIMKSQHPIIELLMEYRKVNHLYNNFVVTMRGYLDPKGMIHPSYNLHGTVTGRLSSSEPNAQQYPRHSNDPLVFQYSNDIKNLFTSRFGSEGVMIQFDYSQLELRILAVFSQDKNLIDLYRSGADLHKTVASQAFNKPVDEITKDERTSSKKLQFGIVYQESAKGLASDLQSEGIDMTVEDCENFISNYFKQYPSVEKWVNATKRFAKRNKYVKSLTNRIRHLPTIDSTERSLASEAIRQAVNAPIQSSGSDCTMMSLIHINKWLKETGKSSKIAITVHDSIVVDSPKDEAIEVAEKMKHIMENLAEYNPFYKFLGDVPIVSECEIGYSYGDSYECDIDELKEQGIDNFLQQQISKKREKEQEVYKKAEDKGQIIPPFVEGYWKNI